MKRRWMDFAVFWLVIFGPTLISIAGAIWYGSARTPALWVGFAGTLLLMLAFALQLQQEIWKSQSSKPTSGSMTEDRGGKGGNAFVFGNRSGAIGGPAGESGIVPGGPGGNAEVHGDDSLAIGGQGGGAPQADGRGGSGGVAGLGMGYSLILPDGHRMSDFGRGGEGAHTAEYLRTHWIALTIDEIVALYSSLRTVAPEQIHILCSDEKSSDLAASFVDLFGRLRWPDADIVQGAKGNAVGIVIRPDNVNTRKIAAEIARVTNGRIRFSVRPHTQNENEIVIAIGAKAQ